VSNSLKARLTRLEAKSDQASTKFVVVTDEAERDALARAGGIARDTIVIIRAFLVRDVHPMNSPSRVYRAENWLAAADRLPAPPSLRE